jgi:hypothetical protein
MASTTEKATKAAGGIRSMNIPGDVRDGLRSNARARGISMSKLTVSIMEDYVNGKLIVPSTPGPQIVSTSMWVPPELWQAFIAKTEAEGHSTQWILRTWLDREDAA